MRLAVVQTDPVFGDVEANVSAAEALIGAADADLFVLPELFNTGYNFMDEDEAHRLSEKTDGSTFRRIADIARRKRAYIAYGFAEDSGRVFNSAALVGPVGLVGIYRKIHLYFRENLFFAPGDLGFPVFDLPFGKIGMMICFDWMYPESARTLAMKGAQVIAHPSNLVMPYCPDAMVTRCLENRVFAATANRIGREDRGGVDLRYIGTSEIVSPRGEILHRMSADGAGIAVAEVDPSVAAKKQINEFNDLINGRRPDQYF